MKRLAPYTRSVLVGILGAVLSILLGVGMGNMERSLAVTEFHSVAKERITRIQDSIDIRLAMLRTVVGLFNGSSHVTHDEFKTFINTIRPTDFHIEAVGWAPQVTATERAVLEQAPDQPDGKPFLITERGEDGGLIPAKERNYYYPIRYLAPITNNRIAIGYDLGSNAIRRVSLIQAAKTGEIVASDRIQLVSSRTGPNAILFFVPVYRKAMPTATPQQRMAAFRGAVVGAVMLKSLVESSGAVSSSPPHHLEIVDLDARDGNTPLVTVHHHPGVVAQTSTGVARNNPDSVVEHSFDVAGRHWKTIVISRDQALENSLYFDWIAFFLGLFVSSLVVVQMHASAVRSRSIAATVEKRTQDLAALTNKANEAAARIQAIIDNTSEGMIVIDEHGRIETFNPAAEKIFGYTFDEVFGRDVSVLLPKSEREQHKDYIAHSSLHSYRIINQARELWGRRKDGREFAMELNVAPLDQDGERRFIGIFRDVTERRLAEQKLRNSEARFKDFTDSASDWIWETDPELRFTFISERFFDLSGVVASEMIGKTRFEYAHSEDRISDNVLSEEAWAKHEADMRAHRAFRDFRYVVRTPSGQDLHISLNGKPVFSSDGTFQGYRGTGTDITALVAANKDLRIAKEEAESANRAKSEFLSAMSHELRTPLNAILGFSQLLETDPRDPLSDNQADSVAHILASGEHLLGLINDVLDLAKIESGNVRMEIEPVDPMSIIHACLIMAKTMGVPNGVNVLDRTDKETLPLVRADRVRLKQILLNFLSNAVKYNNEGGYVTFSAEVVSADMMRFTVTDTGPGIPHDQQPHMFEAFNRLGAENGKIEGTGIGLVITKELVVQMGGRLGFDSTPGKGSSFWFELPIERNEQSKPSWEVPESEKLALSNPEIATAKTIIYVEDNDANFLLMKKIFARFPEVTLLRTETAEAGLILAEEISPSLILMDIALPGLNGIDALKILREKESTASIPVVAVSANAMARDIEKGLEAGFDDYLTKPVAMNKVVEIVSKFISSDDTDAS